MSHFESRESIIYLLVWTVKEFKEIVFLTSCRKYLLEGSISSYELDPFKKLNLWKKKDVENPLKSFLHAVRTLQRLHLSDPRSV